MSVRTSACLISLSILLGFILFVRGEHFYLPKENNVFSNDLQDDWVPVSGIDKRSTRLNNGFSQVVHITPPARFTSRPLNLQPAASNKIEVFAQPPPTILGSFSEFGHATIEAREPAHTLNFRPSYNFDRHYEETNDRRFQQNDYSEPEDQKPPAIVVFNAQQRHPQNYQKPPPPQQPPQFYQNFQFHNTNNNPNNHNNNHNNNNHKSFGFKEPPIVQDPPKRLTPYYVPNDHIFPRPQGNNKQVYAEQRPKPYLVSPSEPIQQQQQQQQQHKQHHHTHHHHHQLQHQQQQQQQQQTQQQQPQYTSSTEGGSSAYFQKYPGHVENQNLYPQISNFARPFEQTNIDQNVFIKPNQYVHNLNVGTEVRFGQEHVGQPTRPVTVDLSTAFTHPATRPFSKYQTPTPKNEELYRIFPVKEVNALPAFLPTPVTLGQPQPITNGRPKAPYFKDAVEGGSSEYDAREEQDENESSEQLDILKSPTKPMSTSTSTTTTTTTTVAPKTTRKRKPTTTTTTTTTIAVPDDYDEYAVPNRQQLQLQEQQQDYRPRQQYQQHQDYETVVVPTTEASTPYSPPVREERPVPVSVNKFKKKKPLPSSRPKEPYPVAEYENVPERVTLAPTPTPTTTTTTAATTAAVATTTTTSAASQPSAADAAAADTRAKTKSKYGSGTRPRFSIKDYKTTTSTTSTTSTEKAPFTVGRRTTTTAASPAATDPETVEQPANTTARKSYKPRPRPNRYKAGTSTTTTTDEPQQQQQQDTTTERAAYRSKYKPGKYYNRLRTSTDSAAVAAVADEGGEPVTATEPTRPAVYSAKRRTVPTIRTAAVQPSTVSATEEHNALRRSSSSSPLDESSSEAMDAASSEDVDYIATTVAVTPAAPRHKYHTSYAADRPLLPIESFFQSSMAGKRHHNER